MVVRPRPNRCVWFFRRIFPEHMSVNLEIFGLGSKGFCRSIWNGYKKTISSRTYVHIILSMLPWLVEISVLPTSQHLVFYDCQVSWDAEPVFDLHNTAARPTIQQRPWDNCFLICHTHLGKQNRERHNNCKSENNSTSAKRQPNSFAELLNSCPSPPTKKKTNVLNDLKPPNNRKPKKPVLPKSYLGNARIFCFFKKTRACHSRTRHATSKSKVR